MVPIVVLDLGERDFVLSMLAGSKTIASVILTLDQVSISVRILAFRMFLLRRERSTQIKNDILTVVPTDIIIIPILLLKRLEIIPF